MRDFEDARGNRWDAIVGKESWGTLVVVFAAHDGAEVRKSVLEAETSFDAESQLDAMSVEELRDRLESAEPWS